ncbi:MAG: hypothetical protein HOK72_05470 [Flavobacteriales bacterium]|nr:hypothetical protein [Flavobacteriales bacterium]
MMKIITIDIAGCFIDVIDPTIHRLSYLYPNAKFSRNSSTIEIEYLDNEKPTIVEETIRKDVHHQIYRAKIYQDTLPMRKWFYE